MATIELKHLCKRFVHNSAINLDALVNPFTTVIRSMKRMPTETDSSNSPRETFVMEDLNLTIPDGKTLVILGPSGCGKSTLLRLIAGLMEPDSGEVLYDGEDVQELHPGERQIGMVFQNYALYPHLTSRNNVLSYFLFRKHTPELDEVAMAKYRKTSELLGVDIEDLMDKKPTHLSGGEKQRIAVGRCITREPKLFLLDEPFSNLDQPLREKYRVQLKRLLRHFHITTIYVTHDQQEALILADLLAIMDVGSIEQIGTPGEIYQNPKSMFVANFLNFDTDTPAINFIDGTAIAQELQDVIIGVRSEDIDVCEQDTEGVSLTGRIIDVRHIPIKRTTILCITVNDQEIYANVPLNENLTMGNEIRFRFKMYHIFDRHSGLRLEDSYDM